MNKRNPEAWNDCMQHAYEEAAAGIENWEYGGAESEEERVMTLEAAAEVAKRIRAMALKSDRAFRRRQALAGRVEG